MIGEIDGVKIIATPKQYEKHKKHLEEQLEERDKEIERLNNIINKIVNIYESKDTTEDVYFALEELFKKENITK